MKYLFLLVWFLFGEASVESSLCSPLTFENGRLRGFLHESAFTLEMTLRTDGANANVEFRRVPVGTGKMTAPDLAIPPEADFLSLHGVRFPLPKDRKGSVAFFSFLIQKIDPAWYYFQKKESLHFDCMIFEEPSEGGNRLFSGRRILVGRSKKELWKNAEDLFRILVTPDGGIFETNPGPGSLRLPYRKSRNFLNREGVLVFRAAGVMRYYKCFLEKEFSSGIAIPRRSERVSGIAEVNAPSIHAHLAALEKSGRLHSFSTGMTPEKFSAFLTRFKKLKKGMSPEDVKNLLGAPDGVFSSSPKRMSGENRRISRCFSYRVLHEKRNLVNENEDIAFTLRFLPGEETGRFRLSDVY